MTENQNPFDDTSQKVAELLEDIDEHEDISESKLDKILEELNLTKASLLKYVILIVLCVFLFKFFMTNENTEIQNSANNQSIVVEQEEKGFFSRLFSKETDTPSKDDVKPSSLNPVNQIGILPSIQMRNIQTFQISSKIAKANNLSLVLETYLLSYKRMKNLYDVDLNSYLNSKTDRQKALEVYIEEYVLNYQILKANILKLESEILNYKTKLEETSILAKSFEEKFFANVDSLNPYELDAILQDFKDVNLRKTALTNELKSREIVFDRIANRDNIIQSRLDGILANKDALIKGVVITEVDGSNLNLKQ